MSEYGIGSADTFKIVHLGGAVQVDYDLMQAQNSPRIKYRLNGGAIEETDIISIGDSIVSKIVDDIERKHDYHIEGFIVDEHSLGHFINEFPEERIFLKS